MLNRRYLRVKVLQALYAWFLDKDADRGRLEHELFCSIEQIFNLYLKMLLLIVEVKSTAQQKIEEAKRKKLPTEEDLNPNTKFVDNRVIALIESNTAFQRLLAEKEINWKEEEELITRLFRKIRDGKEYKEYLADGDSSFEADREFLVKMYKRNVSHFELLEHHLAGQSVYWIDDLVLVNINTVKTISAINEKPGSILLGLYKDARDDQKFVKELFRKTIGNEQEYEKMIGEKTQNWEVERIAMMDVILMKMALCEFEHFNTIPVKVSLNEYIELSKSYSTPMSKMFINGVLDKLLTELKKAGKVVKVGRGLVE